MNPTLLTVLTFAAVVLTVAGIYSIAVDLFLRDRSRLSRRLEDEFPNRPGGASKQKVALFKNLDQIRRDAAAERAERLNTAQRIRRMIEQAGLKVTLQQLLTISALTGLVPAAAGGLLGRSWLVGGVLLAGGLLAPLAYVRFRRNRRLEKLLSQLPDAFDLISRLIRAGQTTTQAFQGVADEFDSPISDEFSYCYEQQNLGLSPEVAMRNMARRVDLVEVKIFVLAVLVQRQTGGNLAELIDNLAALVRERYRIRGKIKVMTAEGRMEASVLLALPPVVFMLIFFLNRNYASVLLERTGLLWGMAGFMLVGVLWIRRIINFDF